MKKKIPRIRIKESKFKKSEENKNNYQGKLYALNFFSGKKNFPTRNTEKKILNEEHKIVLDDKKDIKKKFIIDEKEKQKEIKKELEIDSSLKTFLLLGLNKNNKDLKHIFLFQNIFFLAKFSLNQILIAAFPLNPLIILITSFSLEICSFVIDIYIMLTAKKGFSSVLYFLKRIVSSIGLISIFTHFFMLHYDLGGKDRTESRQVLLITGVIVLTYCLSFALMIFEVVQFIYQKKQKRKKIRDIDSKKAN